MICDPVSLDHAILMVRTMIEAVDARARTGQLAVHPGVQRLDIRLAIVAARDARLVGHHHHGQARRIGRRDRRHGPGRPLEIHWAMHIARIEVQHPIPVKKGRAARHEACLEAGAGPIQPAISRKRRGDL